MTKHQKIDMLPNLDRRTFIVGTAATGLVLGYSALPDIGDTQAATSAGLEPTAWYTHRHRRQGGRDRRQGRNGPAHLQHHGATRRRGA